MTRTLLYDLETSPLIIYSWDIWETNAIKVIKEWQILTVAWKWLDEKKVYCLGQDDFKGYKPGVNDDKALVTKLRELFDEADITIAHNGNSFDAKKSQARMMIHGLTPPSPYRQIDTKLVAKRYGKFTSNSLDALGKNLSIGQKLDTGGFSLWEGVMAGDSKSWKKMKKYNKQDVVLLEEVYLKLRPWISNHPGVNIIDGNMDACPKCGQGPMQSRGTGYTNRTQYRRYQCQSCKAWSRGTVNEKGIKPQFVN